MPQPPKNQLSIDSQAGAPFQAGNPAPAPSRLPATLFLPKNMQMPQVQRRAELINKGMDLSPDEEKELAGLNQLYNQPESAPGPGLPGGVQPNLQPGPSQPTSAAAMAEPAPSPSPTDALVKRVMQKRLQN